MNRAFESAKQHELKSGGCPQCTIAGIEDFDNMMKQVRAYMLSKKLHDQFVEKYGTCRCTDIQTKLAGRFFNLYEPTEMEAAMKAGMPDKCSTLIGETAKMATKIILEEREAQKAKDGKP